MTTIATTTPEYSDTQKHLNGVHCFKETKDGRLRKLKTAFSTFKVPRIIQ